MDDPRDSCPFESGPAAVRFHGYCTTCGTPLASSHNFCGRCGQQAFASVDFCTVGRSRHAHSAIYKRDCPVFPYETNVPPLQPVDSSCLNHFKQIRKPGFLCSRSSSNAVRDDEVLSISRDYCGLPNAAMWLNAQAMPAVATVHTHHYAHRQMTNVPLMSEQRVHRDEISTNSRESPTGLLTEQKLNPSGQGLRSRGLHLISADSSGFGLECDQKEAQRVPPPLQALHAFDADKLLSIAAPAPLGHRAPIQVEQERAAPLATESEGDGENANKEVASAVAIGIRSPTAGRRRHGESDAQLLNSRTQTIVFGNANPSNLTAAELARGPQDEINHQIAVDVHNQMDHAGVLVHHQNSLVLDAVTCSNSGVTTHHPRRISQQIFRRYHGRIKAERLDAALHRRQKKLRNELLKRFPERYQCLVGRAAGTVGPDGCLLINEHQLDADIHTVQEVIRKHVLASCNGEPSRRSNAHSASASSPSHFSAVDVKNKTVASTLDENISPHPQTEVEAYRFLSSPQLAGSPRNRNNDKQTSKADDERVRPTISKCGKQLAVVIKTEPPTMSAHALCTPVNYTANSPTSSAIKTEA